MHTHNIVPLLALRTWYNHPHRGHEQQRRQNNNINVQTGHALYPRPWDNQPYGRHTQPTGASCQSLPQDTMQVSNTVDLSTDVALV